MSHEPHGSSNEWIEKYGEQYDQPFSGKPTERSKCTLYSCADPRQVLCPSPTHPTISVYKITLYTSTQQSSASLSTREFPIDQEHVSGPTPFDQAPVVKEALEDTLYLGE